MVTGFIFMSPAEEIPRVLKIEVTHSCHLEAGQKFPHGVLLQWLGPSERLWSQIVSGLLEQYLSSLKSFASGCIVCLRVRVDTKFRWNLPDQ
jgi:hypothetical protein